jgi:hypothetical protein
MKHRCMRFQQKNNQTLSVFRVFIECVDLLKEFHSSYSSCGHGFD